MSDTEDAARAFVEAYGTFDFREPEAYRARLLALSTGTVRDAIATTEVDPTVLWQQQTMSTEAVSIRVTSFDEDGATVSVTSEQKRRGVDPSTGQLREIQLRQHVTCRLLLVDGEWLVAEFRLRSEEPLQDSGG